MSPGLAQQEELADALTGIRAVPSKAIRLTPHAGPATIKMTTYAIEDALTGETLEGGFFSEGLANKKLNRWKRKFPAAFVNRVKPS